MTAPAPHFCHARYPAAGRRGAEVFFRDSKGLQSVEAVRHREKLVIDLRDVLPGEGFKEKGLPHLRGQRKRKANTGPHSHSQQLPKGVVQAHLRYIQRASRGSFHDAQGGSSSSSSSSNGQRWG
eukprot:CAMPEP_0185757790 /NCGR_PEP_ID=MMETSP1174-20130828/16284_1 /TAXON_ID=35687 /ORGANISM="Dictyocha speculum, Strain CCMP1381" /LENGTH=123 /DNA_ID=CAMNT_0028437329 /DNA_START=400 /DNA_END=772 /DNA_ORIENTATION=-